MGQGIKSCISGSLYRVDSSRYSDLSLWDTHRTHVPLLTLLQPSVSLDIVKSLLRMYEEGGAIPRWPIANGTQWSSCVQQTTLILQSTLAV